MRCAFFIFCFSDKLLLLFRSARKLVHYGLPARLVAFVGDIGLKAEREIERDLVRALAVKRCVIADE